MWLSDANTAHTERWVRALSQRGHQVLVFSLSSPTSDTLRNIEGVRLTSNYFKRDFAYSKDGGIKKLLYLLAIPKIRSLAKSFQPDIIHAHYVSSYGVLAMLANLRPRIVSIWGSDIYVTPYRSFVHRKVIREALRSANSVLSTSWTMRKQGLQLCNRAIDVIPFGIDTSIFSPENRPRFDEYVKIGTVKSLEDKYGIDFLLRAYADVRNRLPLHKPSLLIYGDGTRRKSLEILAKELGINKETHFMGRVPYSHIADAHRAIDIAVFPSIEDSESFGVSVIEAQACARPVIVSRIGGLPEVIKDGKTGLVVSPKNVKALSDAIVYLINNPTVSTEMGMAGRQRVMELFELENCVLQLETEYNKLLQN
jgi:L-malate glycosyltransferase